MSKCVCVRVYAEVCVSVNGGGGGGVLCLFGGGVHTRLDRSQFALKTRLDRSQFALRKCSQSFRPISVRIEILKGWCTANSKV